MYDFTSNKPNRSAKVNKVDLSTVPDLSTPEVSFHFHNYIDVSNQVPAETFLADILADESQRSSSITPVTKISSVNFGFPMPQSTGFGAHRYGYEAGIKQELAAGAGDTHNSFSSRSTNCYAKECGYAFAGLPELPNTALNSDVFGGDEREVNFKSDDKKSRKKMLNKESDDYRRRREKNNEAVKKCRKKAKLRWNDTERRVCDLGSENDQLRKKVELLSKELSVLKNLLSNVGVPPEIAAKKVD